MVEADGLENQHFSTSRLAKTDLPSQQKFNKTSIFFITQIILCIYQIGKGQLEMALFIQKRALV